MSDWIDEAAQEIITTGGRPMAPSRSDVADIIRKHLPKVEVLEKPPFYIDVDEW